MNQTDMIASLSFLKILRHLFPDFQKAIRSTEVLVVSFYVHWSYLGGGLWRKEIPA